MQIESRNQEFRDQAQTRIFHYPQVDQLRTAGGVRHHDLALAEEKTLSLPNRRLAVTPRGHRLDVLYVVCIGQGITGHRGVWCDLDRGNMNSRWINLRVTASESPYQ